MTHSHIKALFVIATMLAAWPVRGDDNFPETDSTTWPGIKFQITQVVRIDPNHVLMAVRVTAGSTAPASTFLGFLPPPGSNLPPKPLALAGGYLIEPKSKEKFNAERGLPGQPFLGPNRMSTTMGKGDWIQLAVLFKAPQEAVPVAGEPPPPQPTVDVYLPEAKVPIYNIEIPKLKEPTLNEPPAPK